MLAFHFRIAQVEHGGQTRYTLFLDFKTLIYTYYFVGHRLEFKLCLSAHFFPNAHRSGHPLQESETTCNLDLQELVVAGLSVAQWITIFRDRLLKYSCYQKLKLVK